MKNIFVYFQNQLALFSDNISDYMINFPMWFYYCLASILIILFIIPGQFNLPPLDRDEARFAQASKQMIEDNDYVKIQFQEKLRAKKPIGIYWIQSFSASLFGKNKISSYRIPNIFAAFLTCILTGFFVYTILTKIIGQSYQISVNVGILSSIFLSSLFGFAIEIRQAKTDTFLLLICLIQQWLLWKVYYFANSDWNNSKNFETPWIVYFFWFFVALGILIKGPISPLLAFLTVLSMVILDRISLNKWNLNWLAFLSIIRGLIIILIVNLPWVLLAWNATDGKLILNALNDDLLQKIISGQENHGAPPGTHFIFLFFTFWPLSLLIPLAGRASIDWKHQQIIRFLLSWIIPFWLVMEIVPTKLPHYILPVFPALIALIMIGFSSPPSGLKLFSILRNFYKSIVVIVSFLFIFVSFFIILKFSTNLYLLIWVPILGIMVLFSVFMGLSFSVKSSRNKLSPLYFMTIFAGLFNIVLIGSVIPNLDKIHISPKIYSEMLKIEPYPEVIVSAGYSEPSLIFFLGKDTFLVNSQEASIILIENPEALAIVEKRSFKEFQNTISNLNKKIEEISVISGYNLAKGENVSIGLYKLEKIK